MSESPLAIDALPIVSKSTEALRYKGFKDFCTERTSKTEDETKRAVAFVAPPSWFFGGSKILRAYKTYFNQRRTRQSPIYQYERDDPDDGIDCSDCPGVAHGRAPDPSPTTFYCPEMTYKL